MQHSLIDHSDIYKNMQKSILDSTLDVKTQLLEEIIEKQRDKEREQMAESRDKPKFVEEIKAQLGEDQEEIITTRRIPEARPYRLSIEGSSSQAIVQEIREKLLMFEKFQKIERLLKVFKMLLHQFSKNSRNSHLSAEDKTKNKTLKEDWVKIKLLLNWKISSKCFVITSRICQTVK